MSEWTGAMPPPPGNRPDIVLVEIGDVAVTATTIFIPGRSLPVKGAAWIVRDQSRTEEKMATWALVVGLLTFWWTCFLGLLFLLVKERRTTGYVEVDVRQGDAYHVTQIPISDPRQVAEVRSRVDYARQVSAQGQ